MLNPPQWPSYVALVVPYVTPPSILSGALNRFVWFIYFIRRTGSKQTDLYCVSEIYDFKSLVDIVIVVWYIGRTILPCAWVFLYLRGWNCYALFSVLQAAWWKLGKGTSVWCNKCMAMYISISRINMLKCW